MTPQERQAIGQQILDSALDPNHAHAYAFGYLLAAMPESKLLEIKQYLTEKEGK